MSPGGEAAWRLAPLASPSTIAALPLPLASVDCWAVDIASLPGPAAARALALLCDRERARAERFHQDRHRGAFVASHAAVRLLLGRYLGTAPAAIRLRSEPDGRPVLAEPATDLWFNLSHSGRIALLAVSSLAPVGVDVEEVLPMSDHMDIARGHFAPAEVAALQDLPPEAGLDGFFATWTRKEAVVKALGLGLSVPLDAFGTGRPDRPPSLDVADGVAAGWTLADLAPGPGYKGALAIGHARAAIAFRHAAWPWLLGADPATDR